MIFLIHGLTQYRPIPDLCEILVKNSKDVALVKRLGVGSCRIRSRYKINGKFKFWAASILFPAAVRIIQSLYRAAGKARIAALPAWVQRLPLRRGWRRRHREIDGQTRELSCAPLCSCCGFEANPNGERNILARMGPRKVEAQIQYAPGWRWICPWRAPSAIGRDAMRFLGA